MMKKLKNIYNKVQSALINRGVIYKEYDPIPPPTQRANDLNNNQQPEVFKWNELNEKTANNGNCLFLAIHDQLKRLGRVKPEELCDIAATKQQIIAEMKQGNRLSDELKNQFLETGDTWYSHLGEEGERKQRDYLTQTFYQMKF